MKYKDREMKGANDSGEQRERERDRERERERETERDREKTDRQTGRQTDREDRFSSSLKLRDIDREINHGETESR